MGANQARDLGLYAEVFDDTETMDHDLEAYCSKLSAYNPEALSAMKKIFWATIALNTATGI